MKKLLFTIAGLLQVLVVFAQKQPLGKNAVASRPTQYAQRSAANTVNNQVANQKINNAWLIVDVEGTMPNGRIPGTLGIYQAIPERPLQVK